MIIWKLGVVALLGVGLVVCSPDPDKVKRQLDFDDAPHVHLASADKESESEDDNKPSAQNFRPQAVSQEDLDRRPGQEQFAARPRQEFVPRLQGGRPIQQQEDDFDDDRRQLRPAPSRSQFGGPDRRPGGNAVEEDEEEQKKPDRLQTLLQNTKFECTSKKTGYYADDSLECEVFHYCSEGVKHSWLCPEGQVFHQIHLICMPKSSENICTQSEKFHFVNDYLYKPVNENSDNETLRYHDRFFPEGYVHGLGQDDFDPQDSPQQRRPQQNFNKDQFSAPPQRSPPPRFNSAPQRIPAKIPIEDLDEDEDDFPPPRPQGSGPPPRPFSQPPNGGGFSRPPVPSQQGNLNKPPVQGFGGGAPGGSPNSFRGGNAPSLPRFNGGGSEGAPPPRFSDDDRDPPPQFSGGERDPPPRFSGAGGRDEPPPRFVGGDGGRGNVPARFAGGPPPRFAGGASNSGFSGGPPPPQGSRPQFAPSNPRPQFVPSHNSRSAESAEERYDGRESRYRSSYRRYHS